MKYEFSAPYTFEEQVYTEIDLDLDSLKGSDIANVTREWTRAGNMSMMKTTDDTFCTLLAAKAAKLHVEFFEQLPAKDYIQITTMVAGFLHN